MGIAFLKGHGTQNDFVVLPDPDGLLDLTVERVRALCDRRRGLGADGVLRVVRRAALAEHVEGVASEWCMDYRNADGSVAEMCGNGVRVFARYLFEAGLVSPAQSGDTEFTIGTRAGDRAVRLHVDGTVTAQMGYARMAGESMASVGGSAFPGTAVDIGNPHLVCRVDTPVAELNLRAEPAYDAGYFPHGVNLEFINEADAQTLDMRVYERGIGETRSCGTGMVAAVAAALHAHGERTGSRTVRVPGGIVSVGVSPEGSTLTGPAVIVAEGELRQAWWEAPA